VMSARFRDPLRCIGSEQPRTDASQQPFHAEMSCNSNCARGHGFQTCSTESLTSNGNLSTFIAIDHTPESKMFAVIKQQVIAFPTDLANRSLTHGFWGQTVLMFDDMSLSDQRGQRRSQDLKVGRIAVQSRNTTVSVGEVNNRAIAKVDCMMLERHPFMLSPNKKMCSARQTGLLSLHGVPKIFFTQAKKSLP
jgi:hypothetical protein